MKVFTHNVEGYEVLNYVYRPDYDILCHFNLASEVGQEWQEQAKNKAKDLARYRGAEVGRVELGQYPWFADCLVYVK